MVDILSILDYNKYSIKNVSYESNKIIYQEKDQCNQVGIVREGKIELIHYSYEGRLIQLGQLEKGDIFGDFLIYSSHPYFPGILKSKTKSVIAFIPKKELTRMLQLDDDFRNYYLRQLSEKAFKLNIHNKILSLSSLREKIVLYLENNISTLEKNRVYVSSKTKLSEYFNVQRPSLSRELKRMKNEKIIDYNRHYIWFL